MSERETDKKLLQEFDRIVKTILVDKDLSALRGMNENIESIIRFAQNRAAGRYDMGLVFMIIALGYGFHVLIKDSSELMNHRTYSDESIVDYAFNMTLADLEVCFSQLGIGLWKTLQNVLNTQAKGGDQ